MLPLHTLLKHENGEDVAIYIIEIKPDDKYSVAWFNLTGEKPRFINMDLITIKKEDTTKWKNY